MSCQQFISNLDGLNDGKDFPKDLLKVKSSRLGGNLSPNVSLALASSRLSHPTNVTFGQDPNLATPKSLATL